MAGRQAGRARRLADPGKGAAEKRPGGPEKGSVADGIAHAAVRDELRESPPETGAEIRGFEAEWR
jgi:hypothetical protein